MKKSNLGTWTDSTVTGDHSTAKIAEIRQPSGLTRYNNPAEEHVIKSQTIHLLRGGRAIGDFNIDTQQNISFAPPTGKPKPVTPEIAAQVREFLSSKTPEHLESLTSMAKSLEDHNGHYAPASTISKIFSQIQDWARQE